MSALQEFGIEAFHCFLLSHCTVPEMKVFVWCFVLFPDECLLDNGGCEHLCEKGGTCSCLTGYQLADDGKHCQGTHCLVQDYHCRNVCIC